MNLAIFRGRAGQLDRAPRAFWGFRRRKAKFSPHLTSIRQAQAERSTVLARFSKARRATRPGVALGMTRVARRGDVSAQTKRVHPSEELKMIKKIAGVALVAAALTASVPALAWDHGHGGWGRPGATVAWGHGGGGAMVAVGAMAAAGVTAAAGAAVGARWRLGAWRPLGWRRRLGLSAGRLGLRRRLRLSSAPVGLWRLWSGLWRRLLAARLGRPACLGLLKTEPAPAHAPGLSPFHASKLRASPRRNSMQAESSEISIYSSG